jgi:hypothetical protein
MELLVTLGGASDSQFCMFLQMSCKASLVAKMEYLHGHNLQVIFKNCKAIMIDNMAIDQLLFR